MTNRIGTKLASDFVFWVQNHIGSSSDTLVTAAPDDTPPDPLGFNVCELAMWAAKQVGIVDFPESADDQIAYCQIKNGEIDVLSAVRIRGALLWRAGVIGIVIGTDRVVEVVSGQAGIVVGGAVNRYSTAAKIPGLNY